jgi:hypothetical protein
VKVWLYLPEGGEDPKPHEYSRLDQVIELPALGVELPIAELNRDATLA